MSAGLMAGKKIHGRKRFVLVDTQGLVIAVKVLNAHIDEREGGKVLLLPRDAERCLVSS
jgi:putative transposase